jgi:hypothetical protein
VLIKRDAGITGLTVVLRILNGDDLDESVDFNDGVFKTAGHTTPTLACPAIDATNDPGLYGLSGGFNLTSITIPAGVNTLRFHYTITAGGEVGDSYDVIELDDRLVDLVWDEINRGADHNIKDSTGKQQRQASGGVDTGDVVAAGASTVTLAAGESAIDDFYTHRHIAIVDGLGAGQLRVIDSYVGATKVATVSRPWDTVPDATSDYLLLLSSESTLTPLERTTLRGVFDATHGAGSWLTATGFAVAGDAMALTPAERTTLAGVIDAALVVANPKPWTTGAGASPAVVAAAVWDEILTGAAHNIVNSAGRRLRQLSEALVVIDDSVVDVTPAAGNFDTGLTAVDDFYNDAVLVFISGALAGQSKPISDYAQANGNMTFDEPFTSAPANGDTFLILTGHVHPISQIEAAVQDALTAQGYTVARAPNLDNLDAAISSVVTAIGALNDITAQDVWDVDLTATYTDAQYDLAGEAVKFLRQLGTNRNEIDFVLQTMKLWDDAAASVIGSWALTDGGGGVIAVLPGAPARRGVFT